MLRKTLFVAVAAILTTLAFAADAKAWVAYYYGGYRGYPVAYTPVVSPYTWYGYPANMSYYYGGHGDSRYGYVRRW
jgi:hypothetical protein